ncbi:MAG: acylphosphatase [Methanothrix sp.]|nr:acylphosphatase [Methanothrix sp.]
MKRLTAYVSGQVQRTGYRARIVDFARALGLKGTVENLDDGRVKVIAEGDDDKLKWFEEAIDIKNTLIKVSSIKKEYSEPKGDFANFYKVVGPGETDSRLDTAADHLKELILAVNRMNNNLGGKMDVMIQKQDQMLDKQDQMLDKQDQMLDKQDQMLDKQDQMLDKQDQMLDKQDQMLQKQDMMLDTQKEMVELQHDLLDEVKDSRKDLKSYLDQRFEKLESDVIEMKAALRAKGII